MTERTGKVKRQKNDKKLHFESKVIYQNTAKNNVRIATLLNKIGRPIFKSFLFLAYSLLFIVSVLNKALRAIASSRKHFRKISFPKFYFSLPKIKLLKKEKTIKKPVLEKDITVKTIKPSSLVKLIPFTLGSFFALFLVSYFSFVILKDLPSPEKLAKRDQNLTTKIYDRNGKLLYKIYREKNRTPVSLEKLPTHLIQATIAIEDKDFYHHQGLSLRGIVRATCKNIFNGGKTGGSTITQQLIKNALLSPEKTWERKIKEAVLALLVEKKYSKDQILEMYFNEVGYGGSAYGIEEASQKYFGKHGSELNLAEAALLAGLPVSPTQFSPLGHNPHLAKERQALVLRRMVEDGYITEKQREETLKQEIIIAPQVTEIYAPHFVMYVKDFLVQKYGEKMVEQGGLEVKTSLDLEIQEKVQKIVAEEIKNLQRLHITNGAALVTNPKTGEILAMVGSKNYFDKDIDGNYNVTTALRQPGSSIKPINYSIALENGFTPATLIDDTPITYKVPGQPPYSPNNYDNRFHGKVTLRTALGSSYNVPAVKILASFGVKRMVERGKEMGISTWEDSSRFGLSLTLGGGEVKMTDMAIAYAVFANNGIKIDINPVLEIKNSEGKIIEKNYQGKESPVLSPSITFLINDILSDNLARTPAFGPNSVLNIPGKKVAVKTGTTQNMRDNWTIGYTPSVLTAVWVGNNDNSSMSYVASGITGASPIWRKIMDVLLKDKPKEAFIKPEEIKEVTICQLTGTLFCEGCPSPRKEYFIAGTEPKFSCNEETLRNSTTTAEIKPEGI
ncbi:PBP1A family penicillin-binding protein [Patescibacteria group bacterium]|nr:PBP1A family penicillin-binding protein [Patescibacteria group bacterium]